ncbi:MAG TPA: thioesterase family protein [Vicinamibacterales bacterium]
MSRIHRYHRRVQFAETDMAGMVHFSWYFRYMEEAEHAMWRHAGLSIASSTDDLRFPRVAASFEFRSPLRFEDEFEVVIRVYAIASREIRYACTILRADVPVATGAMTVACIRSRPGSPPAPSDIPDHVARALKTPS